mmetsp:Transcript_52483/g.83321  ORF Transcript_52483/g.83321 Transcript_52483/m.83321 type:complete len:287 (-) Transcript_52483:697-1557(-)
MSIEAYSGFPGLGHGSSSIGHQTGYHALASTAAAMRPDTAEARRPDTTEISTPKRRNLGRQGRERLKKKRLASTMQSIAQGSTARSEQRYTIPVCIDVTSRQLTSKYDHALELVRKLEHRVECLEVASQGGSEIHPTPHQGGASLVVDDLQARTDAVEMRLKSLEALVHGGELLQTRIKLLEDALRKCFEKHQKETQAAETKLEELHKVVSTCATQDVHASLEGRVAIVTKRLDESLDQVETNRQDDFRELEGRIDMLDEECERRFECLEARAGGSRNVRRARRSS